MLRKKLTTITCCAIVAMSFGSCVTTTDDYDSLDDISLDMQIAPDGLSFPLGSLAKIRLDSLIKVKEGGVIRLLDGSTYGISMDNTVSDKKLGIENLTINVKTIDFPSKVAYFGNLPAETDIDYMLQSDIGINAMVSIDQDVDPALVEIGHVDLAAPADVTLKISFSKLPANADVIMDGFQIPFPSYLSLSAAGTLPAGVSLGGSTITIDKQLDDAEKAGGLEVNLKVSSLVFSPVIATAGNNISISEPISVNGTLKLDCHNVPSSELNDISVFPSVQIAPMKVRKVTGKFNPDFDEIHEGVAIALDKDLDFLKNGSNSISLSEPKLIFDLYNSMTVPLKMDLSIYSKNSQGGFIAKDITPDAGTFVLPACPMAETSKKSVLVLGRNAQAVSGDTIFVQISRLPDLMKTIPDSVCINLKPYVDGTVTQTMDLEHGNKIGGSYAVRVPFAFDRMNVEYSDTIKDMGNDMEDIGAKIVGAKAHVKGKVTSTLPLAVVLTLEPYRSNGQKITGLEITSVSVPAGNAVNPKPQPIQLDINVKESGALKDLNYLVLKAVCSSDTHSVLKNDQYLHVTDLVLKFPEGISVDFSDKDKK